MLILFERILNPLLGMSITAAFVAVVVILLRAVLKKRAPKQVVCLLWLVVFARLLVPGMVESPFSLVPNALESIIQVEQSEVQENMEPSAPVESADPAPTNEPAIEITPAVTPGNPVPSQPVSNPTQDPVTEVPPVLEPSLVPEVPPVVQEPTVEPSIDIPLWMPIVVAAWLAGVAVMLVVGIGSYVKLRRRVYDAIRSEDGVWEHPSLASPFILGLIRPKIYLPMGIEGQSRKFILHHERAHLRRLDHVVKPICWLALAIHWFNPLAWVAFLLMSRDIETACDESVIRKLGSEVKADYSATLLALATDKRFPAPSPLSFGEGDAKVRIKNVLKFKKPALWVTIAAVVVVAAAAVCLLTDQVDGERKKWYPKEIVFDENHEYVEYFLEYEHYFWAYRTDRGERELIAGWAASDDTTTFIGFFHPDGTEEDVDNPTIPYEQHVINAAREIDPTWEHELGEHGGFKFLGSAESTDGSVTVDAFLTPENNLLLCRDGVMQVLGIYRNYGWTVDSVELKDTTADGEEEFLLTWNTDPGLSSYTYWWDGSLWIALDQDSPDLSGYATDSAYPGLYFLEEPSSTVGTKITAYKLIDGELVLVGGYDEHMANNFFGLIGPDGEEQYIFASPDEVYAMFEELLAAACRELDPNWTPLPAVGERFLSALNDEVEIVDPGLGMTGMLSELVEATAPTVEMKITKMAAVDLDSDGIKEVLLLLETPGTVHGTMILRCTGAGSQIYGYELWARAFNDIKTDGTFSFSGGVSDGGFGRISFTSGGYEVDRITYSESTYPDSTVAYYVNKQPATRDEFLAACHNWQNTPGVIWVEYTPENAELLLRGQGEGQENPPDSFDFLSSLPTEIVTPDTLPSDPEEYYLVAALPESHVYLYAKNHGEDSLLLWNGNFWWPLKGRIAHTPRMNLPRLYLMDENAQSTTVAAISERASGTEVSVEQLVVYVMGEHQVDSSYYTGLRQSIYDWSSIHEAFNSKKNTLVYDADTNSFTVFWNGRVYNSGELPQGVGQQFALEDGYTGSLFASGNIIKYTYVGGNRFTVTVLTAIEDWPLSPGVTGLDLTWTVEFNGEGFDLVGELSLGSEAEMMPAAPDYPNEIMAAIGGFIEKRKTIPQDYLLYLTDEQRAMAEEYNKQTGTLRNNTASIALSVVAVINGAEKSYYDYTDADYQMIAQLTEVLLFPDYEKRIRENSALMSYLSKHSDSFNRLDTMLRQSYEDVARYENVSFSSYCDLANRLYDSLNRSRAIPATAVAMDATKLVLERQIVPETVISKLDGDTANQLQKYNEQTAELKEAYYQNADSLRYVLFYEKNRATQQWYREEFAQRLSTFALYENYSQLTWSDPVTSQTAAYEAGGSYGLWATYFRHEGDRLEMPQSLLDYLSLVETLLIRLNRVE